GVHLLGIAAREVRPSAGANEQCVPGDEAAVHEEALRAGGVPRRVDEGNRALPHLERVASAHLDEVGAVAAQELAFCGMHVDSGRRALQERFDTGNVVAEEMAAHVVLMGMGDEDATELHPVGGDLIEDRVDLPGGIHPDAIARLRIADEIDEVLHRAQLHLPQVERVRRHGSSSRRSPEGGRRAPRYPGMSAGALRMSSRLLASTAEMAGDGLLRTFVSLSSVPPTGRAGTSTPS